MDVPPSLSPDVLATLPAAVVALIQWQTEQIERLSALVAEVETLSLKNSTNSSKPPSTEHPHAKSKSTKPKSQRTPGAQAGHAKHQRPLIPTQQCQQVLACIPSNCRRCAATLTGADPQPLRHKVWELPPCSLSSPSINVIDCCAAVALPPAATCPQASLAAKPVHA